MTDTATISHAHMRSLVQAFGSLDALAELLNARWGGGHSKGTLSRKMNGAFDWTLRDVIALEDALGEYPVSRTLSQRVAEAAAEAAPCITEQVGSISREAGEAVCAILAAMRSSRAADRAQAIKEIDDALAALTRARACLMGVSDDRA